METRTRRFMLLFSVTIAHAWFDNGGCPFITLEPDTVCRRLLNRKRLIWRRTETGLQVIGETGAEEPDQYEFLILLRDPAFFSITRLDFTDFPASLFSFSNTPKTNRLTLKRYQNPGHTGDAILGRIRINLSGQSPAKGPREPFLLSFEAAVSQTS